MHLTIIAQRGLPGQAETTLHVAGDVLTIDGVQHDLGPVPEGGDAEWPGSPIIGRIYRTDGVIHATVQVRLGATAAADQPPDPAHWIIPDAEGDVPIPAARLFEDLGPEVQEAALGVLEDYLQGEIPQ